MLHRRPAEERGLFTQGWLDARYSFSFANYVDRRHMGVSALRVINHDRIAPGGGFGRHGHDNMEILTYVISGTLTHADTLGHRETLSAGEFQLMSAGTGIEHSEINAHPETIELLQIWLYPNQRHLPPRYAQRTFPDQVGLRCIAAPDEAGLDALPLRQDARIYRGQLPAGASFTHDLAPGRHVWLQMIRGDVQVNDQHLGAGDGLHAQDEPQLAFNASADAEFLLFDLPPTA